MGTAFDTSVIVPALLSWHEHHGRALSVLQNALESEAPLVVPLPALIEAYSVMTRLPPPWRLRPADAHRLLHATFRKSAQVPSLDGAEAWNLLDETLASGVAGGMVYDAHIVACARKANAQRIVTFNRKHFERLNLGTMALVVP